jgi:hypothetical protein
MLLNQFAGDEGFKDVQITLPGDIPANLTLGRWDGRGRRFTWSLFGKGKTPSATGRFDILHGGELWVQPDFYRRTRSRKRREAMAAL